MVDFSSYTTEEKQKLSSSLSALNAELAKLKTNVASRNQPTVLGASTSNPNFRPPAARGDDFSEAFTSSNGLDAVTKTGASISDVIDYSGGRLSYGDLVSSAAKTKSLIQKSLADRTATGTLSTDAMRVSNINTALGESVTAEGARSSKSGSALTDKEVEDLGSQGFFEGDFVPGRGVLKPDGTFDTTKLDSMREQLDMAKTRMSEIQAQADKLYSQDVSTKFDGISTDEPIVRKEQAASARLEEPSLIFENSFAMLDQMEQSINDKLSAEIDSAKNTYKADVASTQERQANEAGQTSVGVAQAGGYLGYSGSGTGVMLSLAKSHRAELQQLKAFRDQAISEARQAAADSRFDVMREKVSLINKIEEEAYNQQIKFLEESKKAADSQAAEAKKLQTQSDIFNAINDGNTSVEDIFNALGGTVDVADINSFLDKTGAVEGGFTFSATQTAKLLGAGLSQDDVKALSEYVAENGYDETVRAALTPSQRAAADKIFRDTTGTGTGNKVFDFTDQEWRKLRQAGLMDASWQEQANYLYGDDTEAFKSIYTGQILDNAITLDQLSPEVQDDVRQELYDLGFDSSAVPAWYQEASNAAAQSTIAADVLKADWEKYRLSSLGELPEEEKMSRVQSWFKAWTNGS